jgi:hypothetical protein
VVLKKIVVVEVEVAHVVWVKMEEVWMVHG